MSVFNIKNVYSIHLEPTQKCQASCTMCDRNNNGGEVNKHLTNADLSLQNIKDILPVNFIKQLKLLYMCGNHGDPIFAPEALEIFEYLKHVNPSIRLTLNTNGGARSPEWWEQLAKVVDVCTFSIDGLEDTNHIYRRGVKWEHVEANLEAFCMAGGIAKWQFIVFKHNQHQIETARKYSQLLGVNEFQVKKSGRFILPKSGSLASTRHAENKKGEFEYRIEETTLPEYKNPALHKDYKQATKKYGSYDNIIKKTRIEPKCSKKREIYISAVGYVLPCCWVNGQMFKFWRDYESTPEAKIIERHGGLNAINALYTPIEEIVNGSIFNEISTKWDGEDRLPICGQKCNVEFDPFEKQW